MIKTFTQDDVIRYVYKETSERETREIKNALLCDAKVQEMYKHALALKADLNKTLKNPRNQVITNILNYSKSLNLSAASKKDAPQGKI